MPEHPLHGSNDYNTLEFSTKQFIIRETSDSENMNKLYQNSFY